MELLSDFDLDTNEACNPVSINITNTTDTNNQNIASWLWDYDNGQTSTSINPLTQFYPNPDTIIVSLEATNDLGCSNTTFKALIVKETPSSSFIKAPQVCVNENNALLFDGSSLPIATFNWDFDGGTANPGTGIGPQNVTWSTPGLKRVSLLVEQDDCTSFFEDSLVVNPLPTVLVSSQFDSDTACSNDSLILTALSLLFRL